MRIIREHIEQAGVLETFRLVHPARYAEVLTRFKPVPKMPWFRHLHPHDDTGNSDTYLGGYYVGPNAEGKYLMVYFTYSNWNTPKLAAHFDTITHDPRQCTFPEPCNADHCADNNCDNYDCDCAEGCDSCEYGSDHCSFHNTYH